MSNRHCEACGQVRLPRDVNHMNLQELEAMVLLHEQQIKDIAAHLLELKQLITPMMQFKRSGWVGLTEDEKHDCYLKIDVWSRCVEAVEAKLREKNCIWEQR